MGRRVCLSPLSLVSVMGYASWRDNLPVPKWHRAAVHQLLEWH